MHLYEANVCTNMMIVARNKDEAVKAAKIYAVDEISSYSKVELSEIKSSNNLPEEWKDLYPYIAEKCIQKQMTCSELINLINQTFEDKKVEEDKIQDKNVEKDKITKNKKTKSSSNKSVKKDKNKGNIDDRSKNKKNEEVKKTQNEDLKRVIKSPMRKDLPVLRF